MNYYHIIFVKNRIADCKVTDSNKIHRAPYYEYHDGQLSYAIVLAYNESQARSQAKYIALELKQKNMLKVA
jgi:hypothetical protein